MFCWVTPLNSQAPGDTELRESYGDMNSPGWLFFWGGGYGKTVNQICRVSDVQEPPDSLRPPSFSLNMKRKIMFEHSLENNKRKSVSCSFGLTSLSFGASAKWKISVDYVKVLCRTGRYKSSCKQSEDC
jgi:hypothetical protein